MKKILFILFLLPLIGFGQETDSSICIEGDCENGSGYYIFDIGKYNDNKSDGNRYFGEFKDGKFHGNGVFVVWDFEFMYAGEWKDGNMHGQGTSIHISHYDKSTTCIGLFKNNEFIEGKCTDAKGNHVLGY